MTRLKFDLNNMLDFNVGRKHGIGGGELKAAEIAVKSAWRHVRDIIGSPEKRISLGFEWAHLPFQDGKTVGEIQRLGDEIGRKYENVVSLGIGGSYLGLKAAQDALCPAYYNEFKAVRKGRPRIYFEGNNLDPDTLSVLLKNLNPKKTFIVVISKSGETTETKAALAVAENWLRRHAGKKYGRQIFVITDPEKGSLRKKVNREREKDSLSFRNAPLLRGVGGRYSELNTGILHLAIVGVDVREVLAGAGAMADRCAASSLHENPALMYAVIHALLYRKKGKSIAVLMPFSESLRSTADWYVQLLAESLGKKYQRKIMVAPDGREKWAEDRRRTVNTGRTPVSSRGTNDLHSIQQNNMEGENNKAVTFIRVEKFAGEMKIPRTGDFLSGKKYSELIRLAQEATEWALTRENRPNCTIIMPAISPYHWGELIYFFEMATAFEGELLNVNAFNQPGVEGYKNYLYHKLRRPGVPDRVAKEIRGHPLIEKAGYVIR